MYTAIILCGALLSSLYSLNSFIVMATTPGPESDKSWSLRATHVLCTAIAWAWFYYLTH